MHTHPTTTNVIITSQNPIKNLAVEDAFRAVFYPKAHSFIDRCASFISWLFGTYHVSYLGIPAPSGVSDQPASIQETKQGALNRLLFSERQHPNADYHVAMEGGVVLDHFEVFEVGYIAIKKRGEERIAWAEISRFPIPYKVAGLVRKGKELGLANDEVFGLTNSKQKGGMPAILTRTEYGYVLNRYDVYYQALVLAFSQLKNSHLYRS